MKTRLFLLIPFLFLPGLLFSASNSIVINSGDEYATSNTVSVTLSASFTESSSKYAVYESTTDSLSFIDAGGESDFPLTQNFTLSSGDGTKKVFFYLRGGSNVGWQTLGVYYSCTLINGGGVKCWGYGTEGQLGHGSTTTKYYPTSVSGISSATQVAVGYYHACSLLSGGTVKCWGRGRGGRLGNGLSSNSTSPVSVLGISTATQIAAGGFHTCALLSGGSIKCWGSGSNGELGDGSSSSSSIPVSVSGISTATQVTVGGYHTCALLSGGSIKCWGYGLYGQIGDGSFTSTNDSPKSVSGISTAIQVGGGYHHTCALLRGGSMKCWGYGAHYQLGNASTSNQSSPVSVSGISNATQIAANYFHTCALLNGGEIKCWGFNDYGQMGDGSSSSNMSPESVYGISNATMLAAGYFHNCAILSNNTMKCWGHGAYGEMGNGSSSTYNYYPVTVFSDYLGTPSGGTSLNLTASDSIVLDVANPTISTFTLSSGTHATNITTGLSISATDGGVISGYDVTESSTTPSNYIVHSSTSLSLSDFQYTFNSSVEESKPLYLHVRDAYSHTSKMPLSVTYDQAPTNLSFSLPNGNYTTQGSFFVSISAQDTKGVNGYYFSESSKTPSSDLFTSVTSTKNLSESTNYFHSLNEGESKNLHVWFKDTAGGIAGPITQTIGLESEIS